MIYRVLHQLITDNPSILSIMLGIEILVCFTQREDTWRDLTPN